MFYDNLSESVYKFLPRDAMRKRLAVGRCPSVYLSVCLSVTLVHFIQTHKDIVKLHPASGSPSF